MCPQIFGQQTHLRALSAAVDPFKNDKFALSTHTDSLYQIFPPLSILKISLAAIFVPKATDKEFTPFFAAKYIYISQNLRYNRGTKR